jgi:ribonuclease J
VWPALDQVFAESKGRILVASFASLISRIQQVGEAAKRHNRKIAFVGMSMRENAKMARKLGYLNLPDELIVPIDQALKMKDHEIALMCTGSQGEPTSIMGRLAAGTNRQFDLKKGDTVVLSSHPIPGNEESVYRTINRLFERGANVIYEPISSVHVSGHASQEEMKHMLNLIKPRHLIPVHGELRHLRQHSLLAQEAGIPEENISVIENGQAVELTGGKIKLAERVPGGYVFVDGASVGDIGPAVMREREALGKDGFILVNIFLEGKNNHLVKDPEIITRGFVYEHSSNELMKETREQIEDTLARSNGNMKQDVESRLRTFLFNETKRRPMIFVVVNKK